MPASRAHQLMELNNGGDFIPLNHRFHMDLLNPPSANCTDLMLIPCSDTNAMMKADPENLDWIDDICKDIDTEDSMLDISGLESFLVSKATDIPTSPYFNDGIELPSSFQESNQTLLSDKSVEYNNISDNQMKLEWNDNFFNNEGLTTPKAELDMPDISVIDNCSQSIMTDLDCLHLKMVIDGDNILDQAIESSGISSHELPDDEKIDSFLAKSPEHVPEFSTRLSYNLPDLLGHTSFENCFVKEEKNIGPDVSNITNSLNHISEVDIPQNDHLACSIIPKYAKSKNMNKIYLKKIIKVKIPSKVNVSIPSTSSGTMLRPFIKRKIEPSTPPQVQEDSEDSSELVEEKTKRIKLSLIGLSPAEKYGRIREQNNEASRKSRLKKKIEIEQLREEASHLKDRQAELVEIYRKKKELRKAMDLLFIKHGVKNPFIKRNLSFN